MSDDQRSPQRAALVIVLICVFIDMLGYGMIVPLLPYLLEAQNSSGGLAVGLLSSLYAAVQLLVAPFMGALSDRIGRRPVLIGCVLASAAAYTLLGFARSLPLIVLAVGLGGAAGATIATAQAYIADRTKADERARGLGLIGAAFGLGLMLGPASGGLLAAINLSLPPFLAAGLALANGLFGLALLPESLPPERRSRHSIDLGGLLRRLAEAIGERSVRPLLLAIFLLNLAFNGLQSNFTVFSLNRFGWTPLQNGLFFAFVGLCAVITQGWLLGRIQPRFGEARLVVGGLGLMSICLPLVALAPQAWMLYPLVGLMALGSGLAIPAITSLISGRADRQRQGIVMGGVQSVLSLTLVIGPLLAGSLFDLIGAGAPYIAGGIFTGGALIAAVGGLYSELRSAVTRKGETFQQ